jgi:L-lactate dehydrogenase complex protein LldG
MSAAKYEILGKIRAALASPGGARSPDRAADYAATPRAYVQAGSLDDASRLDLFADRLHDYNAVVYRCAEDELASTIAHALEARGKKRMVIAHDLPDSWLPPDFDFLRDAGLDYVALDESEGVLTGCAVAIAFTGTIVLRHSTGGARRALTLIPDYHLCVVFADQLVETVPEGTRKMRAFGTAPITTVSGPSATSDIEMTRVKGVHGPRTLDVILVLRLP